MIWPDSVVVGFRRALRAKSSVNAPAWWFAAYTNLIYHLLPCSRFTIRRPETITQRRRRSRDFKEWGWIGEIVTLDRPPNAHLPVLLLQVRQPEALVSLRQQVEADRSMRKYMWAAAKKCPNRQLHGICAMGDKIRLYSLSVHDPNVDISPPRITTEGDTLAGDRWSLELLSDEAKSKLHRVVNDIY
ncbi:hypothetical protein P691DRAFT_676904 [Macrolepiota fuliginosa MF-IS2]|uniref:Uncharacterized protein n=1 Tax=Macrolepiota fuliginosa MF-IS2 TaxID=1400762 RepID=A0A9P5X5E2_9AGAR|nr:hypothetical protein P691DRAFT_676904 [Macrolepiota fuliginosa MF-IS2]